MCLIFRLRVDDLTSAVKGHIQGWIDVLGELLHAIAKEDLNNLCELFEVSILIDIVAMHTAVAEVLTVHFSGVLIFGFLNNACTSDFIDAGVLSMQYVLQSADALRIMF